ncbi:outer membrane biogenesis protein BamB [Anatilimnocola aggregata]|uniref:Outer membrane biogenesis protein BamB n=1 Tax=Anatilimnocola aggregata TaxID=2528021 RepID=A0A517Y4A4_9BACT|nr:PQQ-binding-like beta-propeller repeat protein [Anatilimnocola aggregata]QDU25088.1 outer membrane biogenesis protein BamB [Anatilimnocola aggregata]
MQRTKTYLAIFSSLMLGMTVSTFLPGCQPNNPTGSSLTSDGDAKPTDPPSIDMPAETDPVKPEETPAATPPAPAPVEVPTPGEPKPEAPADAPPPKPTLGEPMPPQAGVKADEVKAAADKAAELKAADLKARGDAEAKPTEKAPDQVALAPEKPGTKSVTENPVVKKGDWGQWGGTSMRNNVPVIEGEVPLEFAPGQFDRKTGEWLKAKAKNIKWVATLGSQTYGNTVVGSGKVLLGTNNSNGYIKRYPGDTDLGCLVCFDEKDGKFLWQHSSEKLHTGRVHDWPLQGVCCSPLIEGNRLWFVTSRGEVKCLDTEGYYDGKDDGAVTKEPARLFDVVRADDAANDKLGAIVADLEKGKLSDELKSRFEAAGAPLAAGDIELKADEKVKGPVKKWNFSAMSNGVKRDFYATLAGPRLSIFRITTPDDKEEADVIWSYDMMKQLGTSQHNMCSCSVTAWGDLLFVNTSNGVDESHLVVPAPDAPSFICMDKNTGEVYWTDNSPKDLILHGQWSSPTVAILGGEAQVLFGGGDAWLYSFKANKGKDGQPELLWKFDCNPKDSILELGGRGTRNDIISTPVVYDNKVYFATGQDPEHGEGSGIFWCIDPTKRGDISEKLVKNRDEKKNPMPRKRIQAAVEEEGDVIEDNPNSGVVWKYTEYDWDGNGEIDDFMEKFHRSISTPVIKNDLVFLPDFSGLFHCIDAKTGKVYWTYDMLAAAWGSAMIAGDKVMVGDEDGDIIVFNLSKEVPDNPIAEINMLNSVYSTPIIANGVMYIANKDHVFAIQESAGGEEK